MSEDKAIYTSVGIVCSFMFISVGIGMTFDSFGAGLIVFGILLLTYILVEL